MTCIRPLRGFRAPGGQLKFTRNGAWVDRPVSVSCGQCTGCRLERSKQWALRCIHEAKFHERNSFITLTYDNEHVPKDGSVDVSHWQKFAKRLRKRVGPFRFLHCGEYGEKSFRPHYHACIFGLDFVEDQVLFKQEEGHAIFTSALLTEVWGQGFTTHGALNFQSAAYVARYVMKKMTGSSAADEYRRIDSETGEEFFVRPPYVTMSRRPGIAKAWFDKYHQEVYPDDFVVEGGRKNRPPKFYDRLLEAQDPKAFAKVRASRIRKGVENEENTTPDRLGAREVILRANHGSNFRDF